MSEAKDYSLAWKTIFRMNSKGSSWSGHERHCAFLNTGGGRFANVSAVSGFDFADDGRGVAYTDWDLDGDLDLWISNRTAPRVRYLRNDTTGDHHFLALRLEGRTCNRDAIGARVEVVTRARGAESGIHPAERTPGTKVEEESKESRRSVDPRGASAGPTHRTSHSKLTKTLYAGHGFLSQSSKWLHFGLDRHGDIVRVVVRWPGGETETFTGIQSDRRYYLVQGSGKPELWQSPSRRVQLVASELVGHRPKTAGRCVLAQTASLPDITYHLFSGEKADLLDSSNTATLVNLWASWCLPCLAELRHFADHRQEFKEVGLRLIALSVDGFGDDKTTNVHDAQAFLGKLNFPFEHGMANPTLLNKMQLLHDQLFGHHVKLAVPTSFLVNHDGELAAIYRGALKVDQLLDDVRHLGDSASARRQRATPWTGSWHGPPTLLANENIADRFYEKGYIEDAIDYLIRAVQQHPRQARYHAKLGLRLMEQGKSREAIGRLERAVQLDPNNVVAHNHIGNLFHSEGKLKEAVQHYRLALEAGPNSAEVHHNFGVVLQQQGKLDQAIQHYQRALERLPSSTLTRLQLGETLLAKGSFDQGLDHLQRVVQTQPDSAHGHTLLGRALLVTGQLKQALQSFGTATQLDHEATEAWVGMASILATHPDPESRDPQRAIQAAQRAAKITQHEDPLVLDTLSAAYASAGQIDRAVTIEERALQLAVTRRTPQLVNQLRRRLEKLKRVRRQEVSQ